jgi:dihydroxyacetone kinase
MIEKERTVAIPLISKRKSCASITLRNGVRVPSRGNCARTMVTVDHVNALAPAVETVQRMSGEPLSVAALAAARLARTGSGATKSMVAVTGKAKRLGKRSLGQVDPRSIPLALMLEGCADALQ